MEDYAYPTEGYVPDDIGRTDARVDELEERLAAAEANLIALTEKVRRIEDGAC